MSIQIDLNDEICPSCGFPKQDSTGKDMSTASVCFYCYFRGTTGAVKMFLLMCMKESGVRLTTNEVMNMLNDHEINDGKRFFKEKNVLDALNNLAGPNKTPNGPTRKYSMLSKSKIKNGKPGRPVVRFKYFSVRADKYLDRYLANWDSGRPVGIDYKQKRGKWERANSLMIRNKSRAIRTKIRSGEYDRFDFIFPEGLVNEKFHVRKVDECVNL